MTLIDTGPVGSGAVLRAALTHLGQRAQDVTRVVLTHFHDDHAGSAAEVAGWAGAEIIAGAADAPVVRGEQPAPQPVYTAAERELFAAVSQGLYPAPPCRVDREVVDGDVLPFAGGAVVVGTPGHTPGSIAVYLPTHRVLLSGDSVAEMDGVAVLGPFNTDRAQAQRSLQLLAGLDVDIVCVGHGNPLTDGAPTSLRDATDPFA